MNSIDRIARDCFGECGVYPISFCLPRQKIRPFRAEPKQKEVSFIIPGDNSTFVFTDEESYMNEYQISRFAHTYKKTGWDCVRHLEIMAASCLPLFRGIEECPRYTMVHYPRSLLKQIYDSYEIMDDDEYDAVQREVYDWLVEYLASDSMVRYMLRITGTDLPGNALFIDRALQRKPDCLSAMILGGLKNILHDRCEVAFPVDFMYEGHEVPSRPKWWKTNFNIYGILNEGSRSQNEVTPDIERVIAKISKREYDLIVYGSATRSLDLYEIVTEHYGSDSVFFLNGEDDYLKLQPPSRSKRMRHRMRRLLRRDKYSGPEPDLSLDPLSQWRKLLAEIRQKGTVFMRELVA
jgi:hypothetical protein